MKTVKRRRIVVDDSALAERIGGRIRAARLKAGLTQQQLAEGRYTKAYISALEKGHAKPSMAALNFLSERLRLSPSHFLGGEDARWTRLEVDLLLASGRWLEAADGYEGLLQSGADPSSRAELLRGLAEAKCRLGRGLEAIGPATEAIETFRSVRRERDAALAGYWLAYALYLEENTTEARGLLRSLLDQVRSGLEADPDLRMRLLTALAYVETWDGDHAAAVTYLEEARALSADLDDRRRGAFLSALALAYHESGDLEGAIRTGTESVALFTAAEAQHEVAVIHNNLANAYLGMGNLRRAGQLAEEAREELRRLGDQHELVHVLDTEARIALAKGETSQAGELAQRAIDAAHETGNRKALSDALLTMAHAAVQAGQTEAAVDSFEQAAALLREHGPRARLQQVLSEWAELLAALGHHERAYELTREALGSAPSAAGPA
jgi:tetratricopeptide (TPR) repeat protein